MLRWARCFTLLLVLSALTVGVAGAQTAVPPKTGTSTTAAQSPVTHYTLPPGQYEKAVKYARARYVLYFAGTAWGLISLLIMIWLRWSVKFRDLAERISPRRFVQALIFVPLLIAVLSLMGLPLDLYGHSLSLQYDQSVQGWGSWFWDWTKGQLISFVVGVFLTWILYGVIRRSNTRWWFYFWLASIPIIVFLLFIEPVVVEPLFFKFKPLDSAHPELVTQIETVALRGGLAIPRERMFEMEASEKLKSVNAYVTGFGASKRVVVWDTTIQKMTAPQTLFVFGHEMGHYVLGHIPKTIVFVAVVLLIFLYLGYLCLQRALSTFGSRWQIRGADDWASLPVLLTLITIFSFLATPIFSGYSRFQEHQADIYGLEVVHGIVPDSPQVAAESFQALGEINLSDPNPGPFIKFWLYDHPSIPDRVVFAHNYDPWSKGESPQFVK